jgi:Ca-activated chloride channel family protein
VLLLDVSGSMSDPNKLPLAQQSFRMLVEQLTRAIVSPSSSMRALPAPCLNRRPATNTAASLQRSTICMPAAPPRAAKACASPTRWPSKTSIRNAVNRIIIATDGDFNVGITDPEQLQDFVSRKRETGIYLSVFGFGGGNYNDALMQRLAQNGNGVAAYIDTLNEARRVLRDEMASNMFSIADDVKIQVEFNPARVAEYRLIGYETRMLRREDFNNDQVDAGEIGAGHSVTAIYEIVARRRRTFNDELRYQPTTQAPPGTANELAFLRIRYKLPGQDDSRLIERPITNATPSPHRASRNRRAGPPLLLATANCCAAIPISTAAMIGMT